MNYVRHLSLAILLASPQLLIAAEQTDHRYTPKEQIIWSPSAEVAFDRTGKYVTQRTPADGSTINEFNGSMRSVTVARLGPDGKVETYCTSSAEAARAWMAGEIETKPFIAPSAPVMEK